MNVAQRRVWRTFVYGCADLTPGQRLALLALSEFADWPAGTNARPSVKKLAAMCGFQERVVKEALQRGRDLKLIERTARANPKRHLAAVYRLLTVDVSRCASVHLEDVSTCASVHLEDAFLGARDGVSRCTSVHPTKSFTPSPKREGARERDAPPLSGLLSEDEPSPYCAKHPQGANANCGPCGAARKRREEWVAVEPERRRRESEARRAAREACDLCDEHGQIEIVDDDGTVSVSICKHRGAA